MKILPTQWFTLIELLISMTIFLILTTLTYANYAMYQNIAKVRLWLKEVSQSIHEARNMAINWYDKNKINQSIWIFFDINNKNNIKYYWFNYNSWIILSEENLIKERKLQDSIGIDFVSGKDTMMLYFSAIYGEPTLYFLDDFWDFQEYIGDELDISISFRGSTRYPFKRDLQYFKNTNVVDY